MTKTTLTAADLAGLSGPALVALYNSLRGSLPAVKRFATRKDAVRRCAALLAKRPKGAGLSRTTEHETKALELIRRPDQGATLAELCRSLSMTKGSVRNLMGDLRRKGLADVHPSVVSPGRRAYVVVPAAK